MKEITLSPLKGTDWVSNACLLSWGEILALLKSRGVVPVISGEPGFHPCCAYHCCKVDGTDFGPTSAPKEIKRVLPLTSLGAPSGFVFHAVLNEQLMCSPHSTLRVDDSGIC